MYHNHSFTKKQEIYQYWVETKAMQPLGSNTVVYYVFSICSGIVDILKS